MYVNSVSAHRNSKCHISLHGMFGNTAVNLWNIPVDSLKAVYRFKMTDSRFISLNIISDYPYGKVDF